MMQRLQSISQKILTAPSAMLLTENVAFFQKIVTHSGTVTEEPPHFKTLQLHKQQTFLFL